MPSASFWQGRRVLLTGHTGFKGMWAAHWLAGLGAEVTGFALPPETSPNLPDVIGLPPGLVSRIGDIRDAQAVRAAVAAARPELVLHMAAQPLVRRSYREPAETFAVNAMGTVTLLEALRGVAGLKAVLVVTSDKTYENRDDGRAYAESDRLGGSDPYSASKAACELAVACWRESFFAPAGVALASARAGNVIGGGDWSEDRLIPDLWRALRAGRPVELRHPGATRPWQHVLEPLAGYLRYLERLAEAPAGPLPPALNFGPVDGAALTVAELAERFWAAFGAAGAWTPAPGDHPPEKARLAIDARLAGATLGWAPRLGADETLDWTAAWYAAFDAGEDMAAVTRRQIDHYRDRLS